MVLEHPRPLADVAEEPVALDDLDLDLADLDLGGVVDVGALEAAEQLHAGADAEYRPAARGHDLAEPVERPGSCTAQGADDPESTIACACERSRAAR